MVSNMSEPMLFDNLERAKLSDSLKENEFFECDGCDQIVRITMDEYKRIPENVVMTANFRCARCTKRMQELKNRKAGRPKKVSQPPPSLVTGLSPDEPVLTNELGGKQSQVPYRFDLVDPLAMFAMCKVLDEGFRKYGNDENWRRITVQDHLNHMLAHAYAYLAGDTSDDHLSHMACRAMFALGVELQTPEYVEFRRKQIQKSTE